MLTTEIHFYSLDSQPQLILPVAHNLCTYGPHEHTQKCYIPKISLSPKVSKSRVFYGNVEKYTCTAFESLL